MYSKGLPPNKSNCVLPKTEIFPDTTPARQSHAISLTSPPSIQPDFITDLNETFIIPYTKIRDISPTTNPITHPTIVLLLLTDVTACFFVCGIMVSFCCYVIQCNHSKYTYKNPRFFTGKIQLPVVVTKKPHFAQGFVWEFLLSCGNEKATLRTRLRVALKFLKLTAFVNEILWWMLRDSNPRPSRCKRDALIN